MRQVCERAHPSMRIVLLSFLLLFLVPSSVPPLSFVSFLFLLSFLLLSLLVLPSSLLSFLLLFVPSLVALPQVN